MRRPPPPSAAAIPLDDADPGPLLRLAVRCPTCGRVPTVRIPEGERTIAQAQPPSAIKTSIQCHHCRSMYVVTALAYHLAAA